MFLLKKVVSQLFFPMPLCLGLCFFGLALLWWTGKQRTGKLLITGGLLLLTALSYEPVAQALLGPLETGYPIYQSGSTPGLKYVVVLGGGHNSDPNLPLSSMLSEDSLKRLVEGITVQHQNPGCKLVLSGGSWPSERANATIMAEVAQKLGASREDFILETSSRDTADEARLVADIVTTNEFVLVTSASHMQRAMFLFLGLGLHPKPAPTGHVCARYNLEPELFFPSACHLKHTERAFYEFMGLVWARCVRKSRSEN